MDYNNDNQNQHRQTVVLNGEPLSAYGPPEEKPSGKKRRSGAAVFAVLFVFTVIISSAALILRNSSGPEVGAAINKNWSSGDTGAGDSEYVDADPQRGTVHYSAMDYERPDLGGIFDMIDSVEEACLQSTYDEVAGMLDEIYSAYWHFDTMYNLADLRSCIDTTDDFYRGECLFFSENYPLLDQKLDEMVYALASSPLAGRLNADYYQSDYLSYYDGESYYSDELVSLYQDESDLIYEYQLLVSSPQITVDGIDTPLYDYLYDVYYDDDAYNSALEQYYDKYNELAGDIYIQLVQVRKEIAGYLGYDSYIDYAYEYYYRDYSPDDVREYIHDISTGAVPLYKQLCESGAMDSYYAPDYLSEYDNFAALRDTCTEMGGDIKAIFDYMDTYGLYDISASDVKFNNSFQIYLEDWSAPFIMLCPTGNMSDYTTFAHEFGHFIDAYINYNNDITIDATEACSQSMEYLAAVRSGSDILRWKMTDTVELYTLQGAYNAFEEAVYSLPDSELTVRRLNQLAHDIYTEYAVTYDGYDDYGGKTWIDVSHFFSSPFYIVSYIVSNDAAYQICMLELESPGDGVNAFLALADRDWNLTYLENVEDVGLDPSLTSAKAEHIIDSLCSYFDE